MTSSSSLKPFDEKRKDIRHGCQKLADGFVKGQRFQGCIRNESKGGVFVETRGPFLMGDDVLVVYESPIGIDLRRTEKIVQIDKQGIGMKFKWPGYNQ